MPNNFLILGTLSVLGWAVVNGAPPSTDPTARTPVSRVAVTSNPSTTAYATTGPTLEARQAPVPLVRNVRPRAEAPPTAVPAAADPQQQAQDDLDKKAAKAAVEADGYKRVILLGKAASGAWRAKGFRGTTEVLLTVDGTGRVSMD
jgi:hypothetical protein